MRTLPWLILALGIGAVVAAVASGASLDATEMATAAFVVAYGGVGSLLASRIPRHPVGWLLLTASVCFAFGGLLVSYVEGAQAPGPWMVFAGNWFFGLGVAIASTFVLLLFPTGRLPSPRWKAVAWIAGLGTVMLLVGVTLSPDSFEGLPVENPIALPPEDLRGLAFEGGGLALLAIGILASVASLVVRLVRGDETERRQLMWVVLSVIVLAVGLLGTYVAEFVNGSANLSDDLENFVISICLSLVPVAIGVAILKYHLYDIDRIISRTVSYALLAGLLGLVYFGLIALLTTFLPSDDPLVVAAATLAVAALFNPLRNRVQQIVDRRFNRSRYDAEKVINEFTASLRDRVDRDSLVEDWVEVVAETMQPSFVGVWVRSQ